MLFSFTQFVIRKLYQFWTERSEDVYVDLLGYIFTCCTCTQKNLISNKCPSFVFVKVQKNYNTVTTNVVNHV